MPAVPRILLSVVLALLVAPGAAQAAGVPGVQAHLTWSGVDDAEMDRQLDTAKRAGAGLVRVDVGWRSLEFEGKGRYADWYLRKVDAAVAKAQARDLRVLLTLLWTPPWASDSGARNAVPRNPQDYADALAFLVRRYGPRVAGWEIWNEPNQSHFWASDDPVGTYTALLKAAYPAAKAADPSATVVGGVLAESDHEFAEALYARGAKGTFDALSIHPYSGDRSPLDPNPHYTPLSFVAGVPRVRDVMLRHGDDKPLWLTEFGWSTCTIRDQAAWANCVDEPTQAAHLEAAYAQMATWSYVAVGVWYTLKDMSADLGDRTDNRGLVRFDGTDKPALAAYRRASAALAAGPGDGAGPATGSGDAPGETGEPAPDAPVATLVTRRDRVTVAAGARTARVRLACSTGTACAGRVMLTGRTSGGRRTRFGSRLVRLDAGSAVVSVPFTREGRRRAGARRTVLRVTVKRG